MKRYHLTPSVIPALKRNPPRVTLSPARLFALGVIDLAQRALVAIAVIAAIGICVASLFAHEDYTERTLNIAPMVQG